MNRTYKVIFNYCRGICTVVNELAKRKSKASFKSALFLSAASALLLAPAVNAQTLEAGDITIPSDKTENYGETSFPKGSTFTNYGTVIAKSIISSGTIQSYGTFNVSGAPEGMLLYGGSVSTFDGPLSVTASGKLSSVGIEVNVKNSDAEKTFLTINPAAPEISATTSPASAAKQTEIDRTVALKIWYSPSEEPNGNPGAVVTVGSAENNSIVNITAAST